MNKFQVFMETNTAPKYCFCRCGCYGRLFTQEAQDKNFETKNKYRYFANDSHRKHYEKNIYNALVNSFLDKHK